MLFKQIFPGGGPSQTVQPSNRPTVQPNLLGTQSFGVFVQHIPAMAKDGDSRRGKLKLEIPNGPWNEWIQMISNDSRHTHGTRTNQVHMYHHKSKPRSKSASMMNKSYCTPCAKMRGTVPCPTLQRFCPVASEFFATYLHNCICVFAYMFTVFF